MMTTPMRRTRRILIILMTERLRVIRTFSLARTNSRIEIFQARKMFQRKERRRRLCLKRSRSNSCVTSRYRRCHP